jgi:hypothetical protein
LDDVFPGHEHRRPQHPSLVAQLVKAGRCDFLFSLKSSKAVIAARRPFRLSCVAFLSQVS